MSGVPPPLLRHGTFAQHDPPAVTALKHRLLLAAVETSPRFRTDLDLITITQYFATVESLAHVAAPTLHYLATECSTLTLRDGDVFCYQEDPVGQDASALLIVDGSLCGYVNKSFSHRDELDETFPTWNAHQNRKRGVLVDFGDFQTTYAAGALCGFDDLLVGLPPINGRAAGLIWHRRKGIHAQEQTRAIVFKKDTLERAAYRFGLTFERGFLQSQREASTTDVSHLAIFSPLTEMAKQALLQSAPRRLLQRGELLFGSSGDSSTIHSFAIVLSGRLDIYWSVTTEDMTTNASPRSTPEQQQQRIESSHSSAAVKAPLFAIRRGQTIGDQTLGLALDNQFASAVGSQANLFTANRLPIRIVSGEDTTEVLIISHAMYHDKCTEDRTLQAYATQLRAQRQLSQLPASISLQPRNPVSLMVAWAPTFFDAKQTSARSLPDLHQLLWRLRADPVVNKTFFQFPPLVLERLAHGMAMVQFDSRSSFISPTETLEPNEVGVVLYGALRFSCPDGQGIAVLAGDMFGLDPQKPQSAVLADSGTLVLTIPRACVERWLRPVRDELIHDAGSLFHRHADFIAAHPPRASGINEKRKSLTTMSRRTSTQASEESENTGENVIHASGHTDALTTLIQRMGYINSLPHFLLRELLSQATIVHKRPGEIVCHESEPTTSLVMLISGFLRVFSLENMGATTEMFRNHSFCQFSSFHHLLTKHQSYDDDEDDVNNAAQAPSVLTRHRSAMYGVHLQTLHSHNAFRMGVLQDFTKSPATVVAQTPCELLVIDEAAYSQLIKKHAPGIDLAPYDLLRIAGSVALEEPRPADHPSRTIVIAGGRREFHVQLVPTTLLRFVETSPTPLAWLSCLSSSRKQLLLRSARLIHMQAGERLLRHGDIVDHVFIVVGGTLALYVRQHYERVASALDASQRSVRSLMLERNVTSNYSTTSHQLSSVDAGADARRLHHKRAMLQHKATRMVTTSNASEAPDNAAQQPPSSPTRLHRQGNGDSLFVHSVKAAVSEQKRRSIDEPSNEPTIPRKKSVTALTFQSAVSRATLAHRLDQRRSGGGSSLVSRRSSEHSSHGDDLDEDHADLSGSMLLCHLLPGDVYGEESLGRIAYRSSHDILADTSIATTSSTSTLHPALSSTSLQPLNCVQILCIDRSTFLSVRAKTDEEIEQELRGRAKAAKSKWQLAEQIVMSARKTSASKTPKLFDLFKNILNQRYYLTMRAITEIPMLQDLPDAIKREICVGARFEAVERFANAYKTDARLSVEPTSPTTSLRFYFVLSGRVGLFPKNALHGNGVAVGSTVATLGSGAQSIGKHGSVSVASGSSAAAACSGNNHYAILASNMDQCLQEVAAGSGFGEFEILVAEASRSHILAIGLEPTKLLSLPGDLFLRHWPQADEMQRHIAYLRNGGVGFFAKLEIEKVSSLYHALRNETFDRGSQILEQNQPITKSEVILLKDGECSIKSKVTVHTHEGNNSGPQCDDNDDPRKPTRPEHTQEIRVLATIADVREGHIFWLQGPGHIPFSLHAVSARVSITRIAVERLRSILPKSHLSQLEECSEVLAALYRGQVANARRTIVRLMNDKRNAELGHMVNGENTVAFLPSLHFSIQRTSKRAQLQSLVANKVRPEVARRDLNGREPSREPSSKLLETPAIPHARVLASKPINLGKIHKEAKDQREQNGEGDGDDKLKEDPVDGTSTRPNSDLDIAYRATHHLEHYQLHDGAKSLPTAALRGSFPDEPALRRNQRLHKRANSNNHTLECTVNSETTKSDETSAPETTAASSNSRITLQVTLPNVVKRNGSGHSRPRTPSVSQTAPKPMSASPRTAKNSFVVDFYGNAAEFDGITCSDDRGVDLVMDLRRMLHAELQSPASPFRSIRLDPSPCKLHSQGKYYIDEESLISSSPHRPSTISPRLLPRLNDPGQVVDAVTSPRIVAAGWAAKPPRSIPRRGYRSPKAPFLLSPMGRTHGLFHMVEVPPQALVHGFIQEEFLRSFIHRHRRRIVTLEDNVLREFPDDTAIHNLGLVDRATRSIVLTDAQVFEAPTTDSGESEVALKHSFVVDASKGGSVVVLVTCGSTVEKASWMRAIQEAITMSVTQPLVATNKHSSNGSPGSPKFKHRLSMATNLANRERRRLSVAASGRNAVVQGEEVLEVEYRIS